MPDPTQIDTAITALLRRFLVTAPHAAATRLATVPAAQAAAILDEMPPDVCGPVWEALSPSLAADVLSTLPRERAGSVLEAIDPGRAAAALSLLDTAPRTELLISVSPALRREIEDLATYPDDSAGSLMDVRVGVFRGDMLVADAQQALKRAQATSDLHQLPITDAERRLTALVDLKALALADPDQRLDSVAHSVPVVVGPLDERDEIVEKLETFRLEELPVVDADGRLLGILRHSSLIDALKEIASIDIQTMVGVDKDERATSTSWFSVRKRMPWLQINLLTAFLAAGVVALFETTIARFTVLAVLLPVVAGQSGNAGGQTLAVTIRGLALREIRMGDWMKIVRKEANVGLWNGVGVAATCGLAVYVWSGQIGLAFILVPSMIIAMVLACMAGALVPVCLARMRQDPAVASTIILTTITDVTGFLAFLGIATLLSGMLN